MSAGVSVEFVIPTQRGAMLVPEHVQRRLRTGDVLRWELEGRTEHWFVNGEEVCEPQCQHNPRLEGCTLDVLDAWTGRCHECGHTVRVLTPE